MSILPIIAVSTIIVLFSLLALSIRLLISKRGEFRGGSCTNMTPELKDKGLSCSCGSEEACDYEKEKE